MSTALVYQLEWLYAQGRISTAEVRMFLGLPAR